MDREEFEEWVEDHKDEAIGRIDGDRYTLRRWIVLFSKALLIEHEETEGAAEAEAEEEEEEDGDLFEEEEEEG